MIILTIVRHGESTDNVKAVWAGWADAPLSTHGMNQAEALGKSLSDFPIDAIFASNLLRATWTAQRIHKYQKPQPPLTLTPHLREQHFGKAERQPYSATKSGKGFHRESGRQFRFEKGESLDDVRARAEVAIAEFIEPILQKSKNKPPSSAPRIFVVAHGIFNSEFLGALLARRQGGSVEWHSGGMTNTGWTRCEVGYVDEVFEGKEKMRAGEETREVDFGGKGQESGTVETSISSGAGLETSVPSAAPDLKRTTSSAAGKKLPPLSVRIVATNVSSHLEGLKRQQGGIGSSAYDTNQRDIRSFWGGGAAASSF